jgi:hypothetical protein
MKEAVASHNQLAKTPFFHLNIAAKLIVQVAKRIILL